MVGGVSAVRGAIRLYAVIFFIELDGWLVGHSDSPLIFSFRLVDFVVSGVPEDYTEKMVLQDTTKAGGSRLSECR